MSEKWVIVIWATVLILMLIAFGIVIASDLPAWLKFLILK